MCMSPCLAGCLAVLFNRHPIRVLIESGKGNGLQKIEFPTAPGRSSYPHDHQQKARSLDNHGTHKLVIIALKTANDRLKGQVVITATGLML